MVLNSIGMIALGAVFAAMAGLCHLTIVEDENHQAAVQEIADMKRKLQEIADMISEGKTNETSGDDVSLDTNNKYL